MKNIIKKLLREGLLTEDLILPTTLYHGTPNTLDINDMERNNVRRNDIGVIMKETEPAPPFYVYQ